MPRQPSLKSLAKELSEITSELTTALTLVTELSDGQQQALFDAGALDRIDDFQKLLHTAKDNLARKSEPNLAEDMAIARLERRRITDLVRVTLEAYKDGEQYD